MILLMLLTLRVKYHMIIEAMIKNIIIKIICWIQSIFFLTMNGLCVLQPGYIVPQKIETVND
jgi:hypothetical protein